MQVRREENDAQIIYFSNETCIIYSAVSQHLIYCMVCGTNIRKVSDNEGKQILGLFTERVLR